MNRSFAEQALQQKSKAVAHQNGQGAYLVDNRPSTFVQRKSLVPEEAPEEQDPQEHEEEVAQMKVKAPWKQGRKRFINPARRRPGVKKAKWLRILDAAQPYIAQTNFTSQQVSALQAKLKSLGKEEMLVDYMKLAVVKKLSYDALLPMVTVAETTTKRGFPHPFEDLDQFNRFKTNILRIANKLKLAYTSIHIQGSSLRKPDPHDIDIGVMMSRPEYDRMYSMYVKRMDRLGLRADERGRKQIKKAYMNGKFSPRDLAIYGEEVTGTLVRVIELAKKAMENAVGPAKAIDVQFSVILSGGPMDSKPFLAF